VAEDRQRGTSVSPRLAWIGAALATTVLVVISVASLSGDQGAKGSSLDATSPSGLGGLAALLAANGHPVTSSTGDAAQLTPRTTVAMLAAPSPSAVELQGLRRFVRSGGQLVTGGPAAWISQLLPDPPSFAPGGDSITHAVLPVPEDNAVTTVVGAGGGSWSTAGATLPVIAGPGGAELTIALLGRGRVAMLADASPLQNSWLAERDNAALGIALAGGRGRPVVFLDSGRSAGAGGLAALPRRWKWLLVGLLAAVLVLIAARARRLGDPAPRPDRIAPARVEHVNAVARAIGRSSDARSAGVLLAAAARAEVTRQARLPTTAQEAQIEAAAVKLGLDGDERRVLAHAPSDDAELLAAGRALSKLTPGNA
jgi:hypothetical protein